MGPLELLYFLGYRMDRWRKLRGQKRLPVRVLSIGNITLGGTGKTPAALDLATRALERGLTPCILTRGYRGRLKGPVVVTPEMKASEVGDEPLLMAGALWPEVRVIKCADRYRAGLFALEHLERTPDLFILDDGFQHRGLARDMDVVLVNAKEPFGDRRLLPLGRLREPLSELSRAQALVITKATAGSAHIEELKAELRRYNPAAPIYTAGHVAECVKTYEEGLGAAPKAGAYEVKETNWLRGRPVYALSGIADPESFRAILEGAGAEVRGFRDFRDHHQYTEADLREVAEAARASGAPWILTTEKDIMRLGGTRFNLGLKTGLAALCVRFQVQTEFHDWALSAR